MIRQPPQIDAETSTQLAAIVARFSLLPHPDVVRQLDGAVFPTRRWRRADTIARYQLDDTTAVILDDNVSPRWALLWAHGYERQTVASGWQVAHIWENADDPSAFTHLANLAFVPKALTRITDATGPAEAYLKYHAFEKYGWHPTGATAPSKPQSFDEFNWQYLPYCADAKSALRRGATSGNQLMRTMREAGWTI